MDPKYPDGRLRLAVRSDDTRPDVCGAKLRGGGCCTREPMPGRHRCRRHGGAPGSGAPKGNRNRLVHGLRSGEAVALRKQFNGYLRQFRVALVRIDMEL
jgi:hypothetical protein